MIGTSTEFAKKERKKKIVTDITYFSSQELDILFRW